MHWLVAALLGTVQGLTEFLPVSSTAHLLLGGRLLGFDDPGGIFTVMIQLGSILAVMWLYRAKIVHVVRGLPSDPEARRFVSMILLAFVPSLFGAISTLAWASEFIKWIEIALLVLIEYAALVAAFYAAVQLRFLGSEETIS